MQKKIIISALFFGCSLFGATEGEITPIRQITQCGMQRQELHSTDSVQQSLQAPRSAQSDCSEDRSGEFLSPDSKEVADILGSLKVGNSHFLSKGKSLLGKGSQSVGSQKTPQEKGLDTNVVCIAGFYFSVTQSAYEAHLERTKKLSQAQSMAAEVETSEIESTGLRPTPVFYEKRGVDAACTQNPHTRHEPAASRKRVKLPNGQAIPKRLF